MFDGTALGQEIVAQTRAHIERSIEPLARRMAELEETTVELVAVAIKTNVATVLDAMPKPQDGKDADPEQVAVLVRENVERVLAGWERPRDGKDGQDGLDPAVAIVPDDTADLVARAVKLLAEMPSAVAINAEEMQRRSQPAQAPVHVHLPTIDIPQIVMPDSVKMEAPIVNVHVPEQKKRNTETTVVSHDSKGRIKKFVQKEI